MLVVEQEREILSQCLIDIKYLRKAKAIIKRKYFSSKIHGWIWDVLTSTYDATGELATGTTFGERLDRDWRSEEEKDLAAEHLIALRKMTPSGPRQILESLRRLIQVDAYKRIAGGVLDGLDDGDLNAARDAVSESLVEIRHADLVEEPTDWGTSIDQRLAEYADPINQFAARSPLPTVDRITNGGLKAGRVGVLVASTNVGKSAFAVDIGYNNLRHTDAIVIHVGTEETELEINARYDARFTGITKDKFINNDLSNDDRRFIRERFAKHRDKIAGRLKIAEVPEGSSIGIVGAMAEEAREAHPGKMIVLIVDSPEHLLPPTRQESFRIEQVKVFWYLQRLSTDMSLNPIAIWGTVQAPRNLEGRALNASNVSETYVKSQVASLGLGVVEVKHSHDGVNYVPNSDGKPLKVYVTKNRLGEIKNFVIYCMAKLGTCEFREVEAFEDDEAI